MRISQTRASPLSWVTALGLLLATTGDRGWLIPSAIGWLAFGIGLAVLSGVSGTTWAAAIILALLVSGQRLIQRPP